MTSPVDREEAAAEYPHIRKVGRYTFFATCALGLGFLVYAALLNFGFVKECAQAGASLAMLASFMALRDMTKAPSHD